MIFRASASDRMMGAGKLNLAALVTHIRDLNALMDTVLNLPSIPGGKKLIYSHIDMPVTPLRIMKKRVRQIRNFPNWTGSARLTTICGAQRLIAICWLMLNSETSKYSFHHSHPAAKQGGDFLCRKMIQCGELFPKDKKHQILRAYRKTQCFLSVI